MFKIRLLIIIACVALVVASCKKNNDFENENLKNQSPIQKKSLIIGDSITQVNCGSYSFLKFDDKEVFLNTLILLGNLTQTNDTPLYEFEQNFTYTSLRNEIELLSDSLKSIKYTKTSKLLATVLSNDTIIQIDTVAFLLDYNDSSIYEVYPVSCATINILKQKQEVNNDSMYVFKYNFHDPVLHPSGYETYYGKAFRWLKKIFNGCNDIWAEGRSSGKKVTYKATSMGIQDNYEAELVHTYVKQGVYFEIEHFFRNRKDIAGSKYPHAVQVSKSHQDGWKVFCGSWGSSANWPNSTFGNNSQLTNRPYQSTNSLARNHNQVKTYVWFHTPGTPTPPMTSPHSISLSDLNF